MPDPINKFEAKSPFEQGRAMPLPALNKPTKPTKEKCMSGPKKAFDKAIELAGPAQTMLSIATSMIDQGHVINNLTKTAPLTKVILPFRFLSWAGAPFIGLSLAQNGVDALKAPGALKLFPILQAVGDTGVLVEMAASAADLLKDAGVTAAQNVGAWTAPLTAVGVGLQVAGIAANLWGFAETCRTSRKLHRIFKSDKPKEEQYRRGVEFLTKKPATKFEKFRKIFFGTLSGKQETLLGEIHQKYKDGKLEDEAMDRAFKAIRQRITLKKVGYVLLIALAIAAISASLILTFATPVAPLGWVLLGISVTGGLVMIGYNFYCSRALTRKLKSIASKSKPEPDPWYKRAAVKIRRKKPFKYAFRNEPGSRSESTQLSCETT